MTAPTPFPTVVANSTSTLVDKLRYANTSTDNLGFPLLLLTTFVIGYSALSAYKPEQRVIAMSFICMTASLFFQGANLSSWAVTGAFLASLIISVAYVQYQKNQFGT